MTNYYIPINQTMHLQIDVEPACVKRPLSEARIESFPQECEAFNADLRSRGVATTKTAINQGRSAYFQLYTEPDEIKAKVEEHGLYGEPPQALLVKAKPDVFYWRDLRNWLESQQKTHLIVDGIRTTDCVKHSLSSESRPPNVTFYVVYDLLADPNEPFGSGAEWHLETLQKALPNRPDIIYVTRQELLDALRNDPEPGPVLPPQAAPPVTPPPGSYPS